MNLRRFDVISNRLPFLPAVCIVFLGSFCAADFGFAQAIIQKNGAPIGQVAKKEVSVRNGALKPKNVSSFQSIVQREFYPAELQKKASVVFVAKGLQDVVQWIQDTTKMTVFLDEAALEESDILLNHPITESLKDSPVFLLLNRLGRSGVGWYIEDNVIVITDKKSAEGYRFNVPYNVGDLYDRSIDKESLVNAMRLGIGDGENSFSSAKIEGLGDILFVKTTGHGHRKVRAFLQSIRKKYDRVMVFEPEIDSKIRKKLNERFDIDLKDRSLVDFLKQIETLSGLTVRLDEQELASSQIKKHQSVKLKLKKKRLSFILSSGLRRIGLTWTKRHGGIWITTQQNAGNEKKTALFLVKDLAVDINESKNLRKAIYGQSNLSMNGGHPIQFVDHQLMIVRATEDRIKEVDRLIENYRLAIASSKVRRKAKSAEDKIVTYYYRLPTTMAKDVKGYLAANYKEKLWNKPLDPEAKDSKKAKIFLVASAPGVFTDESEDGEYESKQLEYSTLIVTHRMGEQKEIWRIIQNIKNGKTPVERNGLSSENGMGVGGGGFGGGAF